MTIQEWLTSKEKDYVTALALYEALPNCNRHFLKAMQKQTPQNLLKLKYQLHKNQHLEAETVTTKQTTQQLTVDTNIATEKQAPTYNAKVQINDLPLELHKIYIAQKSNFQTACSLKIQLNSLAEHEIAYKALGIIIQIEALFKNIKEAWKIIDYYLDHGEVIEAGEKELKNLSPVQLINKKNSLRSSITRQQARKLQLEEKLKTTVLRNDRLKLEANILKSKKKLLTMQSALNQILNILGNS